MNENLLKEIMGTILQVDPKTLGPASSSDTIEAWDSLKHINLVLALEEGFGVMIPDEDASNMTSYALIKVVLEELTTGR